MEDLVSLQENTSNPTMHFAILDGPAIVNMLRPALAKKVFDYAPQVFLSHIASQLQHVHRVDVWNR